MVIGPDPAEVLYSGNQVYIAEMYERFLDDPHSVDPRWHDFFSDMATNDRDVGLERRGASWSPSKSRVVGNGNTATLSEEMTRGHEAPQPASLTAQASLQHMSAAKTREATHDSIRALMMIRAYRVRGHLQANLDPLGLEDPTEHSELDPQTYGFSEKDMDREVFINYVLGLETATVREIITILQDTYCGSIGVEFTHIQDPDEKAWIQERIERIHNQPNFTDRGKEAILNRLIETEGFEKYLDKKFTGTKRFGLDGGESLVPAMEQIFKRGSQLGVQEIVLGMAHRGRLNVLANVMGKPFQAIFHEFKGGSSRPEDIGGSGDVKYHLGSSSDRVFDGKTVHLSLTANPSHLEASNTVCLGKVRAKQKQLNDPDREKVMCMLLHGDAAFAGQGLVPETFDLSNLIGYKTGGTVHIIINNQIGFTTAPRASRTSHYSSDVAKAVDAPIFHVNADDVEAVVHCARVAIEYRQRFNKDVVIDMICYRRYGHNEGDEPMFTQPLMYKKIAAHPTTLEIYSQKLVTEKVVTRDAINHQITNFAEQLDNAFEAAINYKSNKADWLDGAWTGFSTATGDTRGGNTGVPVERLREIGEALTHVPDNFDIHPRIQRQLKAKKKMFATGENFDWSTAEAMAFGSLLLEGNAVRLSGQDSERGTFSQRHSVLTDQLNEEKYIPLNNLRFGQAPYEVINSPLSEAGVLGFEYGYSLAEPQMLVLWEAQFGDFANGAQVIIDQFIAAGEVKWLRMSGLVMLLPHGYEGQGPEHSSARLERYLQLCAEDNIQVCNCTTPSNYFHVLRRQVHRDFRKPLILMTPKSLLRHKLCTSSITDMSDGTGFQRILLDDEDRTNVKRGFLVADNKINRVVLCSGKVYFDLYEERQKRNANDVYLIRLEQLYPFPHMALTAELRRFKNADIVWCQEEPRNNGSWFFVRDRLEAVLNEINHKASRPTYAGRPEAAAPATGLMSKHLEQQKKLVETALTVPAKKTPRRRIKTKVPQNIASGNKLTHSAKTKPQANSVSGKRNATSDKKNRT